MRETLVLISNIKFKTWSSSKDVRENKQVTTDGKEYLQCVHLRKNSVKNRSLTAQCSEHRHLHVLRRVIATQKQRNSLTQPTE
jgi:hypothetical protein